MNNLSGIVAGLSEAEYHAHPAFSATQAKRILESPARFKYKQDHPDKPKNEFDFGSAVHSKILGTGYTIVPIPDDLLAANGAISTAAAKEFVAATRADGQIPVKAHVAAEVKAVAEAVLAHPAARSLLEQQAGIPEAPVFATCPETGVQLRARFDLLAPICVDLKTIGTTASGVDFAKNAASFGYDVQQGHYLDTLQYATGERRELLFVVVEAVAPHLVAVHRFDLEFMKMGRVKAMQARKIWAECQETGVWPGFGDDITTVSPPGWAVREFEDLYADELEMVI